MLQWGGRAAALRQPAAPARCLRLTPACRETGRAPFVLHANGSPKDFLWSAVLPSFQQGVEAAGTAGEGALIRPACPDKAALQAAAEAEADALKLASAAS